MMLRLHNTLTRTKEDFVPLDAKNVRMYVCGPTVYDFAHIGNARPVIVFDVLFRLLRHLYGEAHVTYVRNITDIDDKINARALAEGHSIREITERTAKQYHEDVAALGCLPPTHEPRATDHIGQMIAMIARLIEAGHAYEADGHVLFDVSSKPDYGKLARRSLDEMIAGARVDVAPYKRGAMDFVLWKPSDATTPGWDSPWGRGRPGWHIECSAMAGELLGETFDIHGGGIDLVFPHHENEIAQSEGAHHNHPLARYWMHNGFLNVEGEKMSKSLGNFVTIRELLADWPGEVLRLNMLMTHYREPINWTALRLYEVRQELGNWADIAFEKASKEFHRLMEIDQQPIIPSQAFIDALENDLNMPQAIAELRRLVRGDAGDAESLLMTMGWLGIYRYKIHKAYLSYRFMGRVLPLYLKKYETEMHRARAYFLNNYKITNDYAARAENLRHINNDLKALNPHMRSDGVELEVTKDGEVLLNPLDFSTQLESAEIFSLIEQRKIARSNRDFETSDRIRDELAAKGIVLKDNADGTTTWNVEV